MKSTKKSSRKTKKAGLRTLLKGKPWLVPAVVVFVVIGIMGSLQLLGNSRAASLSPCGSSATPPGIQHVIVVMMENKNYNQVVGSPNAPYETSLAKQCGVGTAMFGATHSSAANYLAVSAGQYPAVSPPGCGTVKHCSTADGNLYSELDTAGLSWKAYMEAMPKACDPTTVKGSYKIGHNPPLFYPNIPKSECQANDIAAGNLALQSGPFWNDLQNQALPTFSWVSPSEADDGDDSGKAAEKAADAWLEKFMTNVTQSNSYQSGNTLVLIAYDEGTGTDYQVGENCTNENIEVPVTNGVSATQDSCHVPLFVVYPYTAVGQQDGTYFDQYSLTKTVEDLFNLPYLANAADAQTNSLVGHFGIATPVEEVDVTQPTNGGSASGTVTVSGTASDPSSISQVTVSIDNATAETASGTTNWSFPLDTTTLSNGEHTITATAYDSAGHQTSSVIMLNVNN